MKPGHIHSVLRVALAASAFAANLLAPRPAGAAGVTLITHGLNGDVDGWITAMANAIPAYPHFKGTNFTCYEMYFFQSGANYFLTASNVSGGPPTAFGSGEIIVKLDWRQLSDGKSYDTYQIAQAVAPALLSTNFIPDLGGHALAELPLHLIGHSRGGSLVCEISRLLGTNGVWVDHLTTLDPHPLNNDGFFLDALLYSDVDAPARTYVNVLFHDNNWQNTNSPIYGEAVAGAYVRKLTSFSGGYSGLGSEHSDVHLWYHGTITTNTPVSYLDSGSTITLTATMRTNWWNTYESGGAIAGFDYSLIGGGNRLSADHPLGAGAAAIFDGFNQHWDLGAGSAANNRTALTTNYGAWPNLIRVNRATTNALVPGQSTALQIYYQWASPASSNATIAVYLDDDSNPLNTNQVLLRQFPVPATGAGFVGAFATNLTLNASNVAPGTHAFLATITGGGRTRYLYAPEPVEIVSVQPPALDFTKLTATQDLIGINGVPGQTVVLQQSTDLQTWQPLATNTLATGRWVYTNTPPPVPAWHFYRAVLGP